MNAKMKWKQRSPPNHKRRTKEEIVDGNDGENETTDDEDSEEDCNNTTMEYDFDLNYAETDEEQLIIISEKDFKGLSDQMDDEQGFYRFSHL